MPTHTSPTRAQSPRSHGRGRREDNPDLEPQAIPPVVRRRTPLSLWCSLVLGLGAATGLGMLHVHTRVRAYALGEVIAELTAEQTALLDEKQRLEAERAYLRNPRHVEAVARDSLKMTQVPPEKVATVVVDSASEERRP